MEGKGKYWVTSITESVSAPIKEGKQDLPPRTVMEVFKNTATKYPTRNALSVKRDGKWIQWDYKQYYEDTLKVAAGFRKLGFQPGQAVSIIGFNSPEWFIADLAAIAAGGVACGIYTTNGPEACHYVIEHSDSGIVVTENELQTEKVLQLRNRLPLVKKVIQWSGKVPQDDWVMSWEDLIKMEITEDDKNQIQEIIKDLKPTKCCTLIYTSGTTGPPKGVMVSHDNLTYTPAIAGHLTGITEENQIRMVSYLPLSHIAAQMLDIHIPLSTGGEVWFAQPDALKGSLVNTLKEVKPTHFLGVPRVWEKIEEKMRATGAQTHGLKKTIATWAKAKGLEASYAKQQGRSTPWGFWLANHVVFSKIKAALGFDQCVYAASGAAPIARATLDYFMSLNIPIFEIYGMSESTGVMTFNHAGKSKTGTVGPIFEGCDLKIDNPDAEGNGEIIFRGRNMFMGYLKNDKETAESFDNNGYIHSGDVGKITNGFLQITGRIKELIITAGGENIPPVLIEDELKKLLPIISNCMVVGDKRKFLSCLITLKTDPNPEAKEGQYQLSNNLSAAVTAELEKAGSKATTVQEAMQDEKVRTYLQAGIDKYNKQSTSNAQQVQKFQILARDFSIEEGELTPTLKLKRKAVANMYKDTIDGMYGESEKQ